MNEQARLAALAEYRVLDTEAEEIFDAITRIAAYLCDVPIALISLVDRDRQWFKAVCGLNDVRETSRDIAFCSHAILSPGLMEVQDAARDARFHDNPLVTGEPKIRFYAGMPLINPQGHKLGTLCVIDRRPKRLTESQRAALKQLSELVVRLFESRKTEFKAQRLDASLACVNRARRVLAECNNAQARVTTESELLRELCRILVESGGYRQAWVGMPVDDAVRSIAVAAAAGCGDDHPLAAHASWANDGRYQGAMGQVIATGEPYVAQNILTDPKFVRRHKRALERGYQSSATLPLSVAGRCIGAVSIYASEPDAFDTEEVELLKTLAQGVSYGIASLRERAARAQVEERFRATFEQAAVGMAHTTTEGRFLHVNRKLCQMLGYTSPKLLVLTTRDLTHPDDRDKQDALRLELLAGRRSSFTADKRYVRKDGSEIWVNRTVTLARHPVTGEHYLIQVIQDISERKSTEARLARLTRARRVMAECNHILAHATDETKMLEDMCRIVVESGGYKMAWVGFPAADPSRPVYPAAHVGFGDDAPMTGSVAWSADGRYQGFMHDVITTGKSHIARDILNDPKNARRRARAAQHGFQSSIALPLKSDGRVLGAIALYAREPDAFDADEITLLTELTDDIAFGIASLRTRIAREQAEQLSRESEKRFRETFEQAAVGITRVDLNGVLVDFNQKFCDMLGYSREELLGKAIKDITHPDDYGKGAQYRAQLTHRAMKSAAGEKRFVRKDGTIMWARRTMSTALDDAGKPQYVISVVEDITERKELEHRFEMTFNQAAVGMTQTGLDGRLLQVNRKYAEMLGYSREEMVGMSAMEITHPDDRAETGPLREKLLKGELESVAGEKRLVRKDGRVIWVTRTFSLARGVSGEPLCFITVVEDVTGHKELERRYRETFDQAAVGIVHTAIDGRYLRVNQKFCEMLGYSESELAGRPVADFAHPEDREKGRNQRQLLWEGKLDKFNEEKRYIRKDGSVVWTNRTVSLARDESGKPLYFIRVIEDITERKEVEERYRATFDNAPVGIMHTAIDDYKILHANPKLCEMLGYTQDELLSMTSTDVVHPDYRFSDKSKYKEQLLSGESQSFASERKFIRKDGSSLWISRTVSLVKDASGNPLYFIRIIEDISERKRAETALRESEEQFRQLANNIPQAFWITDAGQKQTLYVSPAAETLIGRPLQEILARPRLLVRAVHVEDRPRVHKARKESASGGYDQTYRVVRPDGSIRWVHDRAFPVLDESGKVHRVAGITEDVTDRKLAEERLMHLAHYDVLTSLPNRVLFYDRLRQALAQAKRNQWTVGVMFIDVDRFKNINDTFGHAIGDKLLQQVSERLTGSVRSGDTVGRLGGDEFAIVLSNLSSAQDANLVAQKIMASFSEPFKLEGSEIYATASIGITLYPDDSTEQDTLIKNADAAMYRAKEAGRNNFQFYTPEMNARAFEILSMENSLRHALNRNEFLLYFQPKTSIADGNIVGVEALLRWQHPERGLVSPVEFIPVLEESGLIVPVGEWVLRTVCAQIKAWERAGVTTVPVAVNLSARQFSAKGLGPAIQRILEEYKVNPKLIELEITESSIMANAEEAVKTLEYLKNLGAGLSIDDFGTGYSSLGYLKRFPLTSLKIDSSFVRDLTTDSDDATITRAVISMAHSLGLKVIAEGVETESQLAFLAEYGCDEIQGYYFSRPLPAEDCGTWLREGRRLQRPLPVADSGAPFVLLVDDDDDTLTLLKRSLAKDGYRILTARNAREALDLLGKHHVDAVISDQNMPGIPGVEFLQHIKTLFPQTVRMMTSGHADVQTMADAVNKGEIYRFLPKGQGEDRLRADVREALQARAGNGR